MNAVVDGGHDWIEKISRNGTLMCIIIRCHTLPNVSTFYTPRELDLQIGQIVHPAGSEIRPHIHRPGKRTITKYSEVLFVQKGRMFVDLYDKEGALICSRELRVGDVIFLITGGHGFRLIEDTVLFEVKQGPYRADKAKKDLRIDSD